MSDSDYQKAQDRIKKAVKTRQNEINNLEALINTKSSSDVGGYLDVSIEVPKGFAAVVGGVLPAGLSEMSESSSGITTKPYLISLILGVIMFIGIFLPWVSADIGFGIRESANGTEYGWGILSLIMSIFCILLSFVTITRIKSIGLIVGGILAIIGEVAYWFSARGDLGIFREIISPSFGLVITALAAIGVLIIGIIQYRRSV